MALRRLRQRQLLQATVEVARAVDGLGAVLAELLGKVIAVARHEHLDGVGQLTSRSEHLDVMEATASPFASPRTRSCRVP